MFKSHIFISLSGKPQLQNLNGHTVNPLFSLTVWSCGCSCFCCCLKGEAPELRPLPLMSALTGKRATEEEKLAGRVPTNNTCL